MLFASLSSEHTYASPARPRRGAAGPVAAAMLAATLAACTGSPPPAPPTPARPPGAIATHAGPFQAGPVAPPPVGAWFGAWVKPDPITQAGRVAAIDSYERELGRPLDIVHTYRRLDQDFGTESDRVFLDRGALLMVSWAADDMRAIAAGRHDRRIRAFARQVRGAGAPVLLRFRWEMDRPNLAEVVRSPEDYIAAWRHARRIFAAERAGNVSWVWCPTAEGFRRGSAPAYYPGDDTVDWTCVDAYAGGTFRAPLDLLAPFLAWAATRPKPIIIGEYGVGRAWGRKARVAWLREAADLFRGNPQIKAVCYFESDPAGNDAWRSFATLDEPETLAAVADLARHPWFTTAREWRADRRPRSQEGSPVGLEF